MNHAGDLMDAFTRRRFLSLAGGVWSVATSGLAQGTEAAADITLRIGEITVDLGPRHTVKTIGYNGQSPGPLLRVRDGETVAVEVLNETHEPEIVHWHGLHVPSEVDGSHEEGTLYVPAHGRHRYMFTPTPAGTRWYHTHVHAGNNLQKATYTGQFGILIVEPRRDPGRYDLEVPLLLHEWEPYWDDNGPRTVGYTLQSINGKMLGAGEPIRVRTGQHVLFRIVNASATLVHRLALPGHEFRVIALDGNPVPKPGSVPILELGPAERIDAIVEMKNPGIWALASTDVERRIAGMGIVVEYAKQSGRPRWAPTPNTLWDYTIFGEHREPRPPDDHVRFVLKEKAGHRWTINGKSFPKTDPTIVQAGRRYRWLLDNQSGDPHPLHLHRHTFELIRLGDKRTSGLMKDVVMVPAWKEAEIDVTADHPGPTLFHCHQQFHMDNGFMMMMLYHDA